VWAGLESGNSAHIVKLGTMGEYGNPNVEIPEGYITSISSITKNGTRPRLFPREAGSLYHTTKILDTDLLKYYCNTYDIAVTDLMQGPVYGMVTKDFLLQFPQVPFGITAQTIDALQTHYYYDDLFGTVVNRFLIQALLGIPLTVYGNGTQKKGYISLTDAVSCIDTAIETPAAPGELRVFNQVTEVLSVQEIATMVVQAAEIEGSNYVEIDTVDNPRGYEPGTDASKYNYNVKHTGLVNLGFEPHTMSVGVLRDYIKLLKPHLKNVNINALGPRFIYGR
jgi:UDP-sulfoquinovose synthase